MERMEMMHHKEGLRRGQRKRRSRTQRSNFCSRPIAKSQWPMLTVVKQWVRSDDQGSSTRKIAFEAARSSESCKLRSIRSAPSSISLSSLRLAHSRFKRWAQARKVLKTRENAHKALTSIHMRVGLRITFFSTEIRTAPLISTHARIWVAERRPTRQRVKIRTLRRCLARTLTSSSRTLSGTSNPSIR